MAGYMSENVCLPVDIYEGAGGDLVLCQEFPALSGERFVRVFIDMDRAEEICAMIMRVAKEARRG